MMTFAAPKIMSPKNEWHFLLTGSASERCSADEIQAYSKSFLGSINKLTLLID